MDWTDWLLFTLLRFSALIESLPYWFFFLFLPIGNCRGCSANRSLSSRIPHYSKRHAGKSASARALHWLFLRWYRTCGTQTESTERHRDRSRYVLQHGRTGLLHWHFLPDYRPCGWIDYCHAHRLYCLLHECWRIDGTPAYAGYSYDAYLPTYVIVSTDVVPW